MGRAGAVIAAKVTPVQPMCMATGPGKSRPAGHQLRARSSEGLISNAVLEQSGLKKAPHSCHTSMYTLYDIWPSGQVTKPQGVEMEDAEHVATPRTVI